MDQESVLHLFANTKVGEARRGMKAWLRERENRAVVEEKSREMLGSMGEASPEAANELQELRRVAEEGMRGVRPRSRQGRVALAFLVELMKGLLSSASEQLEKSLRKANTKWEHEVGFGRDHDAEDVLEWLFKR